MMRASFLYSIVLCIVLSEPMTNTGKSCINLFEQEVTMTTTWFIKDWIFLFHLHSKVYQIQIIDSTWKSPLQRRWQFCWTNRRFLLVRSHIWPRLLGWFRCIPSPGWEISGWPSWVARSVSPWTPWRRHWPQTFDKGGASVLSVRKRIWWRSWPLMPSLSVFYGHYKSDLITSRNGGQQGL